MYWQALRGRLLTRPSSYPGVSLMAVTVETGGKLAAQSDRRVNVVGRVPMKPERPEPFRGRCCMSGTRWTGDGCRYHQRLESAYWTPRGEYFDFATGDSISAGNAAKIANAGKSRFLLSDGLATVNRKGLSPGR
jgi:hypothetical protein